VYHIFGLTWYAALVLGSSQIWPLTQLPSKVLLIFKSGEKVLQNNHFPTFPNDKYLIDLVEN